MKPLKVTAQYHCLEPRVRLWVPARGLSAQLSAQVAPSPTYDWSEPEARGILWALMDQFPDAVRDFMDGKDLPE